ncbi:hypothetical protein Tco_1298896, partial [Tanacetum coccineum]
HGCHTQGDREDEVFQVSNDDTAVAQKWLEVKQPEEKTNTDCLVKEQKKEYQTGWKIKTGNVLDSCNQSLVYPRNLGFNESGEYKKTFIGSGVGTGSVQVLQEVKFEVEPQEDHTFEVEPHKNVDQELFSYREDSSEASFAVAAVEKIYTHESLTFNNTVACEVISKWKAGLKDDMDARSDMYVLSNYCKKCSDDSDIYYWEYTPGFTTESWYKTFMEGHSILLLEGILSGDYDVEKNGKWSCIYAVGSQEYQMACTRLDIASADVGMLDKFDRGLQTDVHVLWILTTSWVDQSQAGYMTLTEAAKEAIWLKGLALESGFELKIVAGIATGALSKAVPRSRFQHRFKLLCIEDF